MEGQMQAPLVVPPEAVARRNDEGGICGVTDAGKVWHDPTPSIGLKHALKRKCEALRHINEL